MGVTLELPKDPQDLGDILASSIDSYRGRELAASFAQSIAARRYLAGERDFVVEDTRTRLPVLAIQNPPNQPPYERLVSEVAEEIGKQLLIDVMPSVSRRDQTLLGIRDSAVARGTLAYYFPKGVVKPANLALQENRVIDGVAGIYVEPTWVPDKGWCIGINILPLEELLLLPANSRDYDSCGAVGWRCWAPLSWLKRYIKAYNRVNKGKGTRAVLPEIGTDEYKRMGVLKVEAGKSVREALNAATYNPITGEYRTLDGDPGQPKDGKYIRYVQFSRIFVTTDKRHTRQKIFLAGRSVLLDERYEENVMPQVPMAVTHYARSGGPLGRSFAFPKMMAGLYGERILASLGASSENIDAYGILLASQNMSFDSSSVERYEQGGFRVGTYNTDAGATNVQPMQIKPINLGREYGPLANLFLSSAATVFPTSPIFQGQSTGRIDSDRALERLVKLSQTALAAGAESLEQAWAQAFRAGLELARDYLGKGDSIPLVYVGPEMAGIVLDSAEVPVSQDEQAEMAQRAENNRLLMHKRGIDPNLAAAMGAGDMMNPKPPRVPIPRWTVGPNEIPHCNRVEITIASIAPRDQDDAWTEIISTQQLGFFGHLQAMVRAYAIGLDKYVGGEEIIESYKTIILNLLSAFGNGVETGPVALPPGTGNRMVGWWVLNAFTAGPVFLLASNTVKQQILYLMQAYAPVNMPGIIPTGDEAAQMTNMMMRGAKQRQLQGSRQFGANQIQPQVSAA